MSKINYIIYRPETCNLETEIFFYRDQEKFLKQVDGSSICAFYKFEKYNYSNGTLSMFEICYDIKTWLVKFTDSNSSKQLKR